MATFRWVQVPVRENTSEGTSTRRTWFVSLGASSPGSVGRTDAFEMAPLESPGSRDDRGQALIDDLITDLLGAATTLLTAENSEGLIAPN